MQYAGNTGNRPYDESKLTEDLGNPLFLQMCGVAPKYYGSCGLTHQTIHGTIAIMRENNIGPHDIASIELLVPPWADRIAPFRDPVSGEQAKFSIRQGVAGLLVGGIPDLPYTHAFTDDAARDPRYVKARERVTVTVLEGGSSVRGFADQTVTATLADGRVITKVVPTLEAATYPLEDRIAIFRNTVPSLGAKADQLIDVIMNIEDHTVDEVSALTF
jgi:2-methylcitrate dehydratase PrpD